MISVFEISSLGSTTFLNDIYLQHNFNCKYKMTYVNLYKSTFLTALPISRPKGNGYSLGSIAVNDLTLSAKKQAASIPMYTHLLCFTSFQVGGLDTRGHSKLS